MEHRRKLIYTTEFSRPESEIRGRGGEGRVSTKTSHTFDVVRIITQQKTITTGSKHTLSICCSRLGNFISKLYRRFHVYQHVTSFSHMRSALVGKRTTATIFHRQNTGNVFANTLEYWSKYTNILNPTLREDRPVEVWQIVRSGLGLKKRQDELSRSVVC